MKMVQVFPIRGRALYLVVKRRGWRLQSNHNVVIPSDYSFIAEGVTLSLEVKGFLKGTSRYPPKYDKKYLELLWSRCR